MIASRYRHAVALPLDPARPQRLLRRWAAWSLASGAVIAVAVATRLRWFSADGPAYLLYWLHDYGYLPMKGALWTWGLPHSAAVWGVVALLVALGLADYLLDRPLLYKLPAEVTRRAIERAVGRALLSAWHRWTVNGRWRAQHLELIVQGAWAEALLQWDEVPGTAPVKAEAGRLVTLTLLNTTLRRRTAPDDITIAVDVLETMLRLWMAEAPDDEVARLQSLAADCLMPQAAVTDDGDVFAVDQLAREALDLLTTLRSRDLVVLRTLSAATARRSAILAAHLRSATPPLGSAPPPRAVPELRPPSPPACGRLALLLALATARLVGQGHGLQAYLDSLSGIAFGCLAGWLEKDGFAAAWLTEAPAPAHVRLAAALLPRLEVPMPEPSDHPYLGLPAQLLAWAAGDDEAPHD